MQARGRVARLRHRVATLAVAVGVLAVAGGGCGGSRSDVELVRGVTVDVEARDNTFVPEDTTVAAGTNVRFVNVGRNDHNVIPISDDQDELLVETDSLGPEAEATVRLTEPGTYRYYCSIHGTETAGMIGTVEVTG
ncbi:MAG TPA: plastocyanin/azurin family copper-binding protein [Acidimicrobiia bacterium]